MTQSQTAPLGSVIDIALGAWLRRARQQLCRRNATLGALLLET